MMQSIRLNFYNFIFKKNIFSFEYNILNIERRFFMENKESIKSTYFIVFILGIIETVLAFFGGPLVGIAVLIIAISLRSKLINAGEPVTKGVKLILIASGIHIASLLLWVFNFIMGFLAIAGIFVFFTSLLYLLIVFGVFITLIVACIFIYQEYSAIK